MLDDDMDYDDVSTHSRPKAAGVPLPNAPFILMFQHTAARRRLVLSLSNHYKTIFLFQHTAARRRLGEIIVYGDDSMIVSTHSRPKAAGCYGRENESYH